MHGRFDQVDRTLNTIQNTLDDTLKVVNEVEYEVQQVRQGLLNVQLDIHRLERQLFSSFTAQRRGELNEAINGALYYEHFRPGSAMTWETYSDLDGPENHFYTYASDWADDDINSPSGFSSLDLADANLDYRYKTFPLNANLNYTKEVLTDRFHFNPSGLGLLANPQDWFVSAYAYLQLALENPLHFRNMGLRLGPVIGAGENLTDFFGRLTFSGTNVNWPLNDTLVSNYVAKLDAFLSEVHTTEQSFADLHLGGFAVDPWRDWAARIAAETTTLLPVPLCAEGVTKIASVGWHNLVLLSDGTVFSWGLNNVGQSRVPDGLSNAVDVAAGQRHSVALRADGTILAWGDNASGQTNVPGGATNVIAIAAGSAHSLALKAGGTVVAWGDNTYGQTIVPPGLTNVVAVAGGSGQSLALRADGTVVAWGDNTDGKATVPVGLTNVVAIAGGGNFSLALKSDGTVVPWGAIGVPGGLNGVVAIAACLEHSLALKSNGTVVAWGNNPWGQISVPAGLDGVVAITAGAAHSLALKTDGTIVGWGANYDSQTVAPSCTPPNGVVAVSGGGFHSLALKADGSVVGWGAGSPGTSGANHYGQATIPSGLKHVVAIAAGCYHSLALRSDGTVVGWGENHHGQANGAAAGSGVVAIAAGLEHSLALKADGTVLGWGSSEYGQANGATAGSGVVAIAAGALHSLALKADGTVIAWGYNGFGQTTIPSAVNHVVAISACGSWSQALCADGSMLSWGGNDLFGGGAPGTAGIAMGHGHGLLLRSNGTVLTFGSNVYGQGSFPAGLGNVVAVAAGFYHSLALKTDGTVVACGAGCPGTSGSVHYGQSTVPAVMGQSQGTMPGVKSTALTASNTVPNQPDARLLAGPHWTTGAPALGSRTGSALSFDGVNDYVSATIPALASNYTVSAWMFLRTGDNWGGKRVGVLSAANCGSSAELLVHSLTSSSTDPQHLQLGRCNAFNGTPSEATVPLNCWVHLAVTVSPAKLVSYFINGIAAGSWTAGNLDVSIGPEITLGDNIVRMFNGMLDEVQIWDKACPQEEIAANMTNRPSVTESNLVAYWTFDDGPGLGISQLTSGATKVAAGDDYGLALRCDGTVVAWGANDLGHCQVPTGLSNVVEIAGGYDHSLALRSDGTVVGWGQNTYGQADGTTAGSSIVAIAAGRAHSLALKSDGSVVAWGCNKAGQCALQDLTGVVAIAAGGEHSLALKADGSVSARGANNAGQCSVPSLGFAVAVAAGENHGLALQTDSRVVAWGWNAYGQTSVPVAAQSGVVAIAAQRNLSLALKADGTVVAWGGNIYGQTSLPTALSNVVAMAPGGRQNVFLTAQSGGIGGGSRELPPADVPWRVTKQLLGSVYTDLRAEMVDRAGTLHDKAVALSGAKALLQAVLELGMPYTLQRDDVLHGFFYGAEALADLDVVSGLLTVETNRLSATPDARPMRFEEVAWARFSNLATRLQQCLQDLQSTGQPEIPRLVGHTLRLLYLLRDAHGGGAADSPPPVLEPSWEPNSLHLVLYGEPYARYSLQQCDSLSPPYWTTTFTNVRDEQPILLPCSDPGRFFRAALPTP